MNNQSIITRAEIIALAKEREAQVAFATREFIREHKAEPVKSHPSFVKGWANVNFCGVATALIVGRLAKWAACFDPAEVFDVFADEKTITITAKSVNSSVKLAVRQTVAESTDCPALRRSQKTAERDQLGAPIVVSAENGDCTVAKGRDAKSEKAELKKSKAKLPAMEAMARLQRNAKEALRLREIASGSFADALQAAKCKLATLREMRKRGDAKHVTFQFLKWENGYGSTETSFSRARLAMKKWPAIKARLSAEYIALLSVWRSEYPEPVAPVAPVATTPATVAPSLADAVAPSVRVSEKETATATLSFASYESAKLFCRDWSRVTLRGYDMSAKDANGGASVTLYKVGEDERQWIDARIASEQATPPPSVPVLETKNEPLPITAAEFAKSHPCDSDWVRAMCENMIIPWRRGDAVKYGEFEGTVIRHYRNGMFEVRLPGGVACVGFDPILPVTQPPVISASEVETAIPEPATPPRHESQPIEEKPRQRHSRRAPRHMFRPAAWRGSFLACYNRPRVKPAPLVPVSKSKPAKVHPLYLKAANGDHIAMKDLSTLIRDALKRAFPRCKFSVKSSRGSAINIRWHDGPSGKSVDAIAGAFETRGFDGSIDLAHSNSLWLYPDGSAHCCHDRGTAGSMGQAPEVIESARGAGGIILDNVASCFVSTSRTVTAKAYRRAIEDFRAQNWTGCEAVEWEKISVKEGDYGVTLENVPPVQPGSGWRYLEHEICALAHSYDLSE